MVTFGGLELLWLEGNACSWLCFGAPSPLHRERVRLVLPKLSMLGMLRRSHRARLLCLGHSRQWGGLHWLLQMGQSVWDLWGS